MIESCEIRWMIQKLAVLLLLCTADSNSDFKAPEVEITRLLLNHFHGSFCTYALADWPKKFWPNPSGHGSQFLSVVTLEQAQSYILNSKANKQRQSGKSLVVLKAENNTFSSLRQISQKMTLSSIIWIMYSNKPLEKKDFEGIYIPFNCEFIYIYPRDDIYILTEIYQFKNTSDIESSSFGFWSTVNGLTINEELLYRRRKKLSGHIFKAIIKNVPPYVHINVSQNSHTHEYRGYLYEVWKEIEYRINFGTELLDISNDKHSDVIDMLNADFAVFPVVYHHSTLDQIDITHPIYESQSYLFGHRPGSELEWDSYLKPFDSTTWWVTLGWMICSSAALAILYKVAWSYGTSEKEAEYFIFTFYECIATVFRAMCMQGSDVTPRSISCRLMFLSIYLTALVVSSAFSAALFSLLTIPTARAPFNSFRQVANNKAYEIGMIRDSEIHNVLLDYVSKYPESDQNKLLQIATSGRYPNTLSDGLSLICSNKMYIMISELPYVLHTLQNMTKDCQEKVMPAGPILAKTFIGFGLKKDSPYKELIDLHILMMRNDGIIMRLLLNSWPPHIPTVQASWVRVTLADISPILYMFSLGAILALFFLIAEKVVHFVYWKKKPKEKKTTYKTGLVFEEIFVRF